MDTAGEISVVIKFSPKREKLLENLKEQIKNSEQITSKKTFYHKMDSKSVSST